VIQDSTKNTLFSLSNKANALRECLQEIRLLIKEGYDKGILDMKNCRCAPQIAFA
jgi:hypothetical protein